MKKILTASLFALVVLSFTGCQTTDGFSGAFVYDPATGQISITGELPKPKGYAK